VEQQKLPRELHSVGLTPRPDHKYEARLEMSAIAYYRQVTITSKKSFVTTRSAGQNCCENHICTNTQKDRGRARVWREVERERVIPYIYNILRDCIFQVKSSSQNSSTQELFFGCCKNAEKGLCNKTLFSRN